MFQHVPRTDHIHAVCWQANLLDGAGKNLDIQPARGVGGDLTSRLNAADVEAGTTCCIEKVAPGASEFDETGPGRMPLDEGDSTARLVRPLAVVGSIAVALEVLFVVALALGVGCRMRSEHERARLASPQIKDGVGIVRQRLVSAHPAAKHPVSRSTHEGGRCCG